MTYKQMFLKFDNLKTNMETESNTESKLKENESRI